MVDLPDTFIALFWNKLDKRKSKAYRKIASLSYNSRNTWKSLSYKRPNKKMDY